MNRNFPESAMQAVCRYIRATTPEILLPQNAELAQELTKQSPAELYSALSSGQGCPQTKLKENDVRLFVAANNAAIAFRALRLAERTQFCNFLDQAFASLPSTQSKIRQLLEQLCPERPRAWEEFYAEGESYACID